VTGNMQLAVNTSYSINAPGPAVTVTLPAAATLNDTVTITGTSATAWTVAQNAGQSILTSGLNGNTAPGTVWTPRPPAKVWHWISSDATGEVLLAGEADSGLLNTSRNGGQTWTNGNSPNGTWISSDMTPTGNRMVAVQYGGGMYTSVDFGVTWTRLTHALVNVAAGLPFESVTISADGQRLAAVMQPGVGSTPSGLVLSNNAGTTWTAATLPAGTYWWRGVDSSADGQVIMAVAHTSQIFLSANGGTTWAPVSVPLAPAESWYRVKVSADGNTIAIAGNSYGAAPGTGVYVSHNRGTTWTRGFTAVADYTALAMSGDGQTIGASISNTTVGTTTTPGRVVMSKDGGTTFAPLTMPGTDTDWRALATSEDGRKFAAATGRFTLPPPAPAGHTGLLVTSQGDRTSIGTGGSIIGHQNESVTLKYASNGQWTVQSSTGGPFTIH
jgi:hypothetical protein